MELPLELVNKILMFREIHPSAKIIKEFFIDITVIMNSIMKLYKNQDSNKFIFTVNRTERKRQIIINIINLLFNSVEQSQFRIKRVAEYYEFIHPPQKNILYDMTLMLNIRM